MKKLLSCVLIITFAMFCVTACGSTSSGGGDVKKNDIDGEWTDNNMTYLSVEGENAFIEWGGTDYYCKVDTEAKSITAKQFSWDQSDVVYYYEFINDDLVINTDNDQALKDTVSFDKYTDDDRVKKDGIDGKWTDNNMTTLSLDGNSGLLTWGGTDYKCSIDSAGGTITAKEYSWDQSDVVYNYYMINGYLVITTDNEQALKYTDAFVPYDENSSGDDESSSENKNQYEVADGQYVFMLGEYSVGKDIKAGTYIVEYYYEDYDEDESDNKNGKITVYKDGSEVKSIELKDDSEQRVILEDGQTILLSSGGKDSEFYFVAD